MQERKMIEHLIRLTRGMLLKESIQKFVNDNKIIGYIASGVGSLLEVDIRQTKGKIRKFKKDLEIISLNGIVFTDRCHLHISVSDENYEVFGGHLLEAVINTTCELVIIEISNYELSKYIDDNTGYNEIIIEKKEKKNDLFN